MIRNNKGMTLLEIMIVLVILGGLITSTLLNLFVVPSLYLSFGKDRSLQNEAGNTPQALENVSGKGE